MKRAATLLVVCVLALLSTGLVMLYSMSPLGDTMRYLSRQLIAAALGLAVAAVVALTDYRRFRRHAWVLLAVAVLMLVLVLVPGIGHKANGARRWFRGAGFQFQPSDFAKLALVIALAHYAALSPRRLLTFSGGIMWPALLVGLVMVPVFFEPDWGTALLLGAVGVVMLLVAGVRWRHLLPPFLAGLLILGALLVMNPVRSERIRGWLNPEATKAGVGYQAWQARLALGAGGLTGKGLNRSTQRIYLPEHQTDFIFAVVGEEFGYVGSLTVMVLFLGMFGAGVAIAWRAVDTFGLLVGTGVSFLLGLQAFINLAVVSGALPNKGLALPFVSYGGSNLMMMLTCAGVLLSVARGTAEAEPLPTLTPDLEPAPQA